jgi:hypothetical protein
VRDAATLAGRGWALKLFLIIWETVFLLHVTHDMGIKIKVNIFFITSFSEKP